MPAIRKNTISASKKGPLPKARPTSESAVTHPAVDQSRIRQPVYGVTQSAKSIGAGVALRRSVLSLPPEQRARFLPAYRRIRPIDDPMKGWDTVWDDLCLPLTLYYDGCLIGIVQLLLPEEAVVEEWIQAQIDAAEGTAEEHLAAAASLMPEVANNNAAAEQTVRDHLVAALALSGGLNIIRFAYIPWYYAGVLFWVLGPDDLSGVLLPITQHPKPPDMNHHGFAQYAGADEVGEVGEVHGE